MNFVIENFVLNMSLDMVPLAKQYAGLYAWSSASAKEGDKECNGVTTPYKAWVSPFCRPTVLPKTDNKMEVCDRQHQSTRHPAR